MSFFGVDISKVKFSHRTVNWRKLSGYSNRDESFSGKYISAVNYEVPAGDKELKGRRFTWFSDLHLCGNSKREEAILDEVVEAVSVIKPDFLICGGDLVSYATSLPSATHFLNSLKAPNRIAVMGNWERAKRWFTLKDWQTFFANSGFRLIINEICEIDGMNIIGLDDIKAGRPAYVRQVPQDGATLILAHSPDTVVHCCRREQLKGITLIMCGHTHAGQIRLPFLGPLVTSSRYWRKFDYGLYENSYSKTKMTVSSGLGASCFDFRIFCRRELTSVTFI
ncbi:metallophosphoesterase [Lentisphaerota bacterium ZTH]|nr:metallophosphoesterase [Lentisphaerota bacterium]WET06434.1 metallophosphoesterase [Lentisphaerota bacterium ZTH]